MGALFVIPRNLLFYMVFYVGTIFFSAATLLAKLLGNSTLLSCVRLWSGFHRLCMRVFLGIKVEVQGTMPEGSVLVAMRHESFCEAIDLTQTLNSPVVFAKASLLRIPLWGPAAAAYGLVPVEREQGAKAMRAMITAAKKWFPSGRPLIIFPEGRRIPHGQRPELQAGFTGLYKLLGLPVVPIAVNSGPLYHRTWKKPGTITYIIGEPIPAGLSREEIEKRVFDTIHLLNDPEDVKQG